MPTSNPRKSPAVMGAFKGYRDARCAHVSKPVAKDNVESMLGVIKLHRDAVEEIQPSQEFNYLKEEARTLLGSAPCERGTKAGLSQCAGHRARADRHDRVPDGLRHDRHRTRHRAGEIQTARRRRHAEDRQSHRAGRLRRLGYSAQKSKASSRTSRSSTRLKTSKKNGADHPQRFEARASAGL